MSTETETAQTTTYVASGGSCVLVAGTSLMGSSPSAIWSMINQMQYLSLFLIVGNYISQDVKLFLQGFEFSNINFRSIPGLNVLSKQDSVNNMHYEQPDEDLDNMGVYSGSALVVNMSIISALIFSFITHMV